MNIKIDHINLTVGNIKQSIEWYNKVFDFVLVEMSSSAGQSPWAILANNDFMICMTEDINRKSADRIDIDSDNYHMVYHFGIRIHDTKEWEDKIHKMNLKLYYGGVIEYTYSKSWYVMDPSGHSIEVSYAGNLPLKFPDQLRN